MANAERGRKRSLVLLTVRGNRTGSREAKRRETKIKARETSSARETKIV